jgi:CelD/BcsL family acetyltransferase involved in cellulose biosynthesis
VPETLSQLAVVVRMGGLEVVEEIAADWRRLCDEILSSEPFYRPEWTLAYLRAFAPKTKVIVLSAWADGHLRGVLPLVRGEKRICGLPASTLTCPANAHCSRFGLVHCGGVEGEEVLRSLWRHVKEIPGWDLFLAPCVVEGNGIDQFIPLAIADGYSAARHRSWQSLYLPLNSPDAGEPAWLAETRPKFRKNLRRTLRQLEELGTVAVRHYNTADPKALDHFYRLESSGWKGKQGTAIACAPQTRCFYDEIAQAAARHGYLSLDFLELNGKPISSFLGFNQGGRYFLTKAGYDETYHRFGTGQLLAHEILKESASRGFREFDFVAAATWDEGRWATARRNHFKIFIFQKGFYGSLLHALRISGRETLKKILGRGMDENKPMKLLSPPDNPQNESNSEH